mgnify:FL=1
MYSYQTDSLLNLIKNLFLMQSAAKRALNILFVNPNIPNKRFEEKIISLLQNYPEITFQTVSHPDYTEFSTIKNKDLIEAVVLANDRSSIDVIMKECKGLRWCHNFVTGCERILSSENFVNSGITLTTARGASAQALAEYTIGAMLYFSRRYREWDRLKDENTWGALYASDISRKKVAIVGYGKIGAKIGCICKSCFEMEILGVKRTRNEASAKFNPEVSEFFGLDKLGDACEAADFIVNVLPKTKETQDIFNEKVFERFKKTAVFINIGRGMNVVEADLIKALKANKFSGAALDVFVEEPLPKHSPFYTDEELKKKVLISCHSANKSESLIEGVLECLKENIEAYLDGKPLIGIVEKDAEY